DEVRRVLRGRPEAARERGGPKGSSGVGGGTLILRDVGPEPPLGGPLLYLCAPPPHPGPTNDNAVEIAKLLLDHGADPNAFFAAGDTQSTPLVGVLGEGEEERPAHPRREELAKPLLDRGAEPYDMQVVYNIHFRGEILWFMKLLYEHSVRAGRKADWDDPHWSMLNMGNYGSGARWHLGIAIKNNDLELGGWLLMHGANPNAAPARD